MFLFSFETFTKSLSESQGAVIGLQKQATKKRRENLLVEDTHVHPGHLVHNFFLYIYIWNTVVYRMVAR